MELIESDAHVNGIRLHVYRSGSQKPPLVMAHGITDNGLCFLPVAEQLADEFEIILYDSRGHGKSESSKPGASTLDRAIDLAGLVDALGLVKPFLLGHSMGAVTVALFAGLYPQIPGRIVLEDPPPLEMMAANAKSDAKGLQKWRAIAVENSQKTIEQLVEINRQENPSWPEAERKPWALSKQQFSITVFDEAPIDAQEGNRILGQIVCPTLIITADQEKGAMLPGSTADKLAAEIPAGKHVHISGAGHSIRREQPEKYIEVVRAFLGEHQ